MEVKNPQRTVAIICSFALLHVLLVAALLYFDERAAAFVATTFMAIWFMVAQVITINAYTGGFRGR